MLLITLCPRNVKHVQSPWKHKLHVVDYSWMMMALRKLAVKLPWLWKRDSRCTEDSPLLAAAAKSSREIFHCWLEATLVRHCRLGKRRWLLFGCLAGDQIPSGPRQPLLLLQCLVSHKPLLIRSYDVILQSDWFAMIPGKGHNAINSILPYPFPVGWGLVRETNAECIELHHQTHKWYAVLTCCSPAINGTL